MSSGKKASPALLLILAFTASSSTLLLPVTAILLIIPGFPAEALLTAFAIMPLRLRARLTADSSNSRSLCPFTLKNPASLSLLTSTNLTSMLISLPIFVMLPRTAKAAPSSLPIPAAIASSNTSTFSSSTSFLSLSIPAIL